MSKTPEGNRWHLTGILDEAKKIVEQLVPKTLTNDVIIGAELAKLSHHVDKDLKDPIKNPEIKLTAQLRNENTLCEDEKNFLKARKAFIRQAFAKYADVNVSEVHEDDIPIISAGGSGGGFRAMIATGAYLAGANKSGLFDCLTYVAGVSGSCWGIAQYYTIANCNHDALLTHYRTALSISPGSSESINAVLTKPDAVPLVLGGLTIKHRAQIGITAMDLYGALITGHLLLPSKEDNQGEGLNPSFFKLSNQRKWTDNGSQPLPIYTVVRHERPWKDWKDPEFPFTEGADHASTEHSKAHPAWFQWFEFTPYEIGCDELKVWQPTWSFGRHFNQRISTDNIPEQSLALEMGLWGSAPAGPLSSYLGTIERNLPKGMIAREVNAITEDIAKRWGPEAIEIFEDHHPVHAANNPNPLWHFNPPPNPPGLYNSPRVHYIDAGMDNNLPLYPLAHPSRDIDIILGFDASSDVEKNSFFQRVESFGKRKGYEWTPREGKPAQPTTNPETEAPEPEAPKPEHPTAEYIANKYAKRYITVYDGKPTNPPATPGEYVIGEFDTPQATKPITLLYIPLLPNKIDPEFDPCQAPFVGSYNLVYTTEQVEQLWNTAEANWRECAAKVKEVVIDTWRKKKQARLAAL